MKKIQIGLILVFVMAVLSGCSKGPVMSDEQNDEAAEYVAGMMLKYDKNYDEALLVDKKEEAESIPDKATPVPVLTPSPAPVIDGGKGQAVDSSKTDHAEQAGNMGPGKKPADDGKKEERVYEDLQDIYGLDGFQINYKSYSTCYSYPKNPMESYFSLNAGKDHKLLVLEFDVKNTKNKKKSINLLKENIVYQLEVNGAKAYYKPSITFLINDLQYLNADIEKKASKKALLVFMIKSDPNVKTLNLYVTREDKTAVIKMK